MSESIKEERLRWVLPIIERKMRLVDVLRVCPYSQRSLKRWCQAYREHGEKGLVPRSTRPKTQPNETNIWIKERVIGYRKKTGLCALKLHWRLKRKEKLTVPVSTISKIIKTEGLTRKYRTKKVKYKYIKVERKPGELVEIDVKYVPGRLKDKRYYQYTAIDTASRWRHLKIYDDQSSYHATLFLEEVINLFPFQVEAIKTDNHAIFTNYYLGSNKRSDMTIKTLHDLDRFCNRHNIIHYLIDRGKPQQNGTVERSHREDQEKVYAKHKFKSVTSLKQIIRRWNNSYNNLEHCSLDGKTPNEMLELFKSAKSG